MTWFFVVGFLIDVAFVDAQCKQERNIAGMALRGFVFKKFSVPAIYECDISCEREIRCQSYNYVVGEKSCELNNGPKRQNLKIFNQTSLGFTTYVFLTGVRIKCKVKLEFIFYDE